MTLEDLHTQLAELLYIEDPNLVNVTLASIVANSLQIGDPIWLTIIGPSSGGKSQMIRPFTLAHPEYIHRLDDLTPNTFLSSTLGDGSFLPRVVGSAGILSMDDLTVLFSKNTEARAEILSQFRMLYDGHFSKGSGNKKEDLVWKGYLGMVAGATPSIYRYFSEVADMGERFISYRMKPIDISKAVEFINKKPHTSKHLNYRIADVLKQFLPPLLQSATTPPTLTDTTNQVIRQASLHCTLLRTPVHIDERTGMVDEFAEPEMPFRVMKQLTYLAQGMVLIGMTEEDMHEAIKHTAYSLISDKRRAFARAIAHLEPQGASAITNRAIASLTGFNPDIAKRGMSQLQALHLVSLNDDDGTNHQYQPHNSELWRWVRGVDTVYE